MAQFYAITPVSYVGNHVRPGTLLDSTNDAAVYNAYVAAGGLVGSSANVNLAAAAVLAAGMVKKGANDLELQTVMFAGLALDQGADVGTDLASTSAAKGAALVGINDAGGLITATTVEGALQEIANSAISVQKRTATIAFGDLSGLGAGVKTFTANLGTVLPANARYVGFTVGEGSFVGFDDAGGGGTATIKVGSTSDDDAVLGTVNVATGQTGFPKAGTAGVRGFASAPLYAEIQQAILTSNHDLNTFTAGSVVLNLFFTVKA